MCAVAYHASTVSQSSANLLPDAKSIIPRESPCISTEGLWVSILREQGSRCRGEGVGGFREARKASHRAASISTNQGCFWITRAAVRASCGRRYHE